MPCPSQTSGFNVPNYVSEARGDRLPYVMTLQTSTLAVAAVCRATENVGLRRAPRGLQTRTRPSSELKENLDSSLKTTRFQSSAVQVCCSRHPANRGDGGRVSMAGHVMGAARPNFLQPSAWEWFGQTQGPVIMVLPVSGWRAVKQLDLFGLAGGFDFLLSWRSVEGILSPVAV
ncbi:hypothetical protein ANN_24089 [Periplaneta americana]|uniref:Uncharacterized protein n=1 Tax=Periplaneta americana TaxID=6978 RepID=A0ABQ8S2K4_PERAM|nr:hypothetical protein ANN_24089 [Periplaneta americana]